MNCCGWTRATRCLTLYTEVYALCDKLSKVVCRTSTVASIVNMLAYHIERPPLSN